MGYTEQLVNNVIFPIEVRSKLEADNVPQHIITEILDEMPNILECSKGNNKIANFLIGMMLAMRNQPVSENFSSSL
jgi:hypothetical protein